jgi:hypothetical protein
MSSEVAGIAPTLEGDKGGGEGRAGRGGADEVRARSGVAVVGEGGLFVLDSAAGFGESVRTELRSFMFALLIGATIHQVLFRCAMDMTSRRGDLDIGLLRSKSKRRTSCRRALAFRTGLKRPPLAAAVSPNGGISPTEAHQPSGEVVTAFATR